MSYENCSSVTDILSLHSFDPLFISVSFGLAIVDGIVICGNTLVILAVLTSESLRSVTSLLITSLAVADLLLGILVLPFSITNEILGHNWVFGRVWCQIWLLVDVWMCTASIYNLVVISIERYVAIIKPLRYSSIVTMPRARIAVCGAWALSFIISCPPMVLNWPQAFAMDRQNVDCDCSPMDNSPGYIAYSSTGSFFLPMFIITFVYMRIYKVVRRIAREDNKLAMELRETTPMMVNINAGLISTGGSSVGGQQGLINNAGGTYKQQQQNNNININNNKNMDQQSIFINNGAFGPGDIGHLPPPIQPGEDKFSAGKQKLSLQRNQSLRGSISFDGRTDSLYSEQSFDATTTAAAPPFTPPTTSRKNTLSPQLKYSNGSPITPTAGVRTTGGTSIMSTTTKNINIPRLELNQAPFNDPDDLIETDKPSPSSTTPIDLNEAALENINLEDSDRNHELNEEGDHFPCSFSPTKRAASVPVGGEPTVIVEQSTKQNGLVSGSTITTDNKKQLSDNSPPTALIVNCGTLLPTALRQEDISKNRRYCSPMILSNELAISGVKDDHSIQSSITTLHTTSFNIDLNLRGCGSSKYSDNSIAGRLSKNRRKNSYSGSGHHRSWLASSSAQFRDRFRRNSHLDGMSSSGPQAFGIENRDPCHRIGDFDPTAANVINQQHQRRMSRSMAGGILGSSNLSSTSGILKRHSNSSLSISLRERLAIRNISRRVGGQGGGFGSGGGQGGGGGGSSGASGLNTTGSRMSAELKAVKMVAIVTGCFICCWLGFSLIYLLRAFPFCQGNPDCISPTAFSLFFWLGYANSALNPILYALLNRKFRSAFRKLLTCGSHSY